MRDLDPAAAIHIPGQVVAIIRAVRGRAQTGEIHIQERLAAITRVARGSGMIAAIHIPARRVDTIRARIAPAIIAMITAARNSPNGAGHFTTPIIAAMFAGSTT